MNKILFLLCTIVLFNCSALEASAAAKPECKKSEAPKPAVQSAHAAAAQSALATMRTHNGNNGAAASDAQPQSNAQVGTITASMATLTLQSAAQGATHAGVRKTVDSHGILAIELDKAFLCSSNVKTPPGYESISCGEYRFFHPIP